MCREKESNNKANAAERLGLDIDAFFVHMELR
jgi:hypothetical protein